MSFKVVDWALSQEVHSKSKLILIIIGNYANEWGISYPAQTTVSRKAGISKSTFYRSLDNLVEANKIAVIRRLSDSGGLRSNAYLFPDHDLATREEFNEFLGDLSMEYEEYVLAWENLKQKGAGVNMTPGGWCHHDTRAGVTTTPGLVSPRHPYTINNNIKNEREYARTRDTKFESGTLANDSLGEKIDLTLMWLQEKKKLKHLPPQLWYNVFVELDKMGLPIDEFKEFYSWVEKLDWVTGAISDKLLKSQVEAYLRRDELKQKATSKNKEKNGNTKQGDRVLRIYKDAAV